MNKLKKILVLITTFAVIAGVFNMLNFTTLAALTPQGKIINENKAKEPELVSGYGLNLDNSPKISFESKSKDKIEAIVKDGTGIKSIKAVNTKTKNKKEKNFGNQKINQYIMEHTGPKKGKIKSLKYKVTDIKGKTSVINVKISKKKGEYHFNVSTRVGFSYSNKNLNIILRDNGGINKDKASIEIIDKNNNKLIEKVAAKKMKIKKGVKYNNKIIYGIYQLNINKLTKDSKGYYNIQVNTTDFGNIKGTKIASFTIDKKILEKEKRKEEEKAKDKDKKSVATSNLQSTNKIHFIDTLFRLRSQLICNDAILLESNGKYAMVDTGSRGSIKILRKYLRKKKVKKLEFVIITHDHGDHAGGFIAGLGKYVKIGKVYIKKDVSYRPVTKEVIKKAKKRGTKVKNVAKKENQNIKLGDINISLYNTQDIIGKGTSRNKIDENANSIVSLLEVNGKRILLAGDIEYRKKNGAKIQKTINTIKKIGKVDVYKVSHHGNAKDKNNPKDIIKSLSPKYAIATNSKWGLTHNYKSTINRLKKYGAKKIYCVGEGTVVLNVDGKGKITIKQ